MLADAPSIIKRSLNQRRRQSLAAKSVLDDRVVELAGIARVYVVASTRLSTVHGEDVTGFIGLVCNSVFHAPILKQKWPLLRGAIIVARARIELATPHFSGVCSTD